MEKELIVYRDTAGDLNLFNYSNNLYRKIFGRDSEDVVLDFGSKFFFAKRIEASDCFSYDLIVYDKIESTSSSYLNDSFPLILSPSKMLVKGYGKEKGKTKQIDLIRNSIDWEIDIDFRPKLLTQNNYLGFVSRNKNLIKCISNKDGSEIWSYDVTNLGTWQDYDSSEKIIQVSRILGIYEDQVYLYLNSGKILLLNINTGEKISVLENDKHPKYDTFGDSIELDIKRGKLIQLARQDLIEVDLQSREVSMNPIEDMKSLNIENASRIAYDANHIYFTDKNNQTLGALNRSTHKLDWAYKLSQEGVSKSEQPRYGRDLKLRGNRLYVLDNKFTLHIFEKE
ncbi:MAG TPA: hypothetical protein ENK52_01470 [Saprospiraceae bacterium]|nr:hypothetical protein [Saprospiraceae bacterium]